MQMEAPWLSALQTSYRNNLQLECAKTVNIATISNGCATISALTLQNFDGDVLEFHVDARHHIVRDLSVESSCELIWHFPLSRETYQIRQPQISFVRDGEILTTRWETLTKQLKERYWSLPPDSYMSPDEEEQFTAQEACLVSENFCIFRVKPVLVVHTTYKAPEVVSESRKKHSDRVPVPERRSRCWEHKFQYGQWETRKLNVSGTCPYLDLFTSS